MAQLLLGEVFAINKITATTIRIEFMRGEEVKFISHLDIMRTFERAIRRAGIPIEYSQGFNPKPSIIFGLPLSVGVTSLTEYADIGLIEELSPSQLKDKLNRELPKSLKIFKAEVRQDKKNIMSLIYMASYEIFVDATEDLNDIGIEIIIKKFMKKDTIAALKYGKKGTREIDIRPMIYDLSTKTIDAFNIDMPLNKDEDKDEDKNNTCIYKITALLRAGGEANLKPELLIEALNKHMNLNLKLARIHRTGLFINKNGILERPL